VDLRAAALSPAAEIDPGVRILMMEQTRAVQVGVVAVGEEIAPPGVPGVRRYGMCRRSDGQEIQDQMLTGGVPTVLEKTVFRQPAMRQGGFTIEHPGEVDTLVNPGGEPHNLRVMAELLARGKDAGHQQRGIDGGQLAARPALAG